jgi:hypothetical protein
LWLVDMCCQQPGNGVRLLASLHSFKSAPAASSLVPRSNVPGAGSVDSRAPQSSLPVLLMMHLNGCAAGAACGLRGPGRSGGCRAVTAAGSRGRRQAAAARVHRLRVRNTRQNPLPSHFWLLSGILNCEMCGVCIVLHIWPFPLGFHPGVLTALRCVLLHSRQSAFCTCHLPPLARHLDLNRLFDIGCTGWAAASSRPGTGSA